MIDAYNFLHFHPSTKLLIQHDKMEQARSHLHFLLKHYTEQKKQLRVVLVYDAVSLPRTTTTSSSSSSSSLEEFVVSDNVTCIKQPGCEADTVIIDYVRRLYQQLAQAPAAAAPELLSQEQQQRPRITVITNDQRIQDDVISASITSNGSSFTRLLCSGNKFLSNELQPVENKLQGSSAVNGGGGGSSRMMMTHATSAMSSSWPSGVSPDEDSHDWAQQLLRRRRQQKQQQQQNSMMTMKQQLSPPSVDPTQATAEASRLLLHLSDEELLSATTAAAVAAADSVELDELLQQDVDALFDLDA
jgi:predicted RNA-binding protein with PIN domain